MASSWNIEEFKILNNKTKLPVKKKKKKVEHFKSTQAKGFSLFLKVPLKLAKCLKFWDNK